MAAAALRSAARKVCGGAFERPQAYFTTAASAALKEEQGRLLPRISHGRNSLRRFSSSESQNLLNNSKVATISDDIIPPDSPFWKMKVEIPLTIWEPQHPYYVHHKVLWVAGTLAMCYGIAYAELNYLPRHRFDFIKPNKDERGFDFLRTNKDEHNFDFLKTKDEHNFDFLKTNKDGLCGCKCCVH